MTSDPISTLAQILPATILVSILPCGPRLLQCGLKIVEAWPALRWPSTPNIPCRIAQASHLVVLDFPHLIALASKMKKKNRKLLLLPVLLDHLVDRLQMVVLLRGFRYLVATFCL